MQVIGETLSTPTSGDSDLPSLISKRLYDAVDTKTQVGWSLKTVLVDKKVLLLGQEVPFVIQRADIFKKYKQLGFITELTKNSLPADLGKAIVQHWNNKVDEDSRVQNVTIGKLAILVKNRDRQEYVYIEHRFKNLIT